MKLLMEFKHLYSGAICVYPRRNFGQIGNLYKEENMEKYIILLLVGIFLAVVLATGVASAINSKFIAQGLKSGEFTVKCK